MKYNLYPYLMLMISAKSIAHNTYVYFLQDSSLVNGLLKSKCLARDVKYCKEFCLNLPTEDKTYTSTSVSLKKTLNLQAKCNIKVEHDLEEVDLGEAVCYQIFLGQFREYPDLVLIYPITNDETNNAAQYDASKSRRTKKKVWPSSSSNLPNSSHESDHIVHMSDKNSSWHINNVHSGNNYLQKRDWTYINNMHILQKEYGTEGKIVLYKEQRFKKVFLYNNRVYYEQSLVNISILVPQIHPDAFAAWIEIEARAKIISEDMSASNYTTLDSFLCKKASNGEKNLHLLVKQIINEENDVAIMFMVLNNDPLAYIKETNKLCLSYCEELGWGPFSNYTVSCCAVNKAPELGIYKAFRRILPYIKPIMVYSKSSIRGKKKVTMIEKMRMASRNYFCTNKNNSIKVNNMKFLLLEETKDKETRCFYPTLDNVLQLNDGSLLRGIIIKFSVKTKDKSNDPENLYVTYSEGKYWDFYQAKQIFNNPDYWFVKLSETVITDSLIGHIYKVLPKESNQTDKNKLTDFSAYSCNFFRSDFPNITYIYSKENVIEKFIKLTNNTENENMTKYLRFMWEYRHIKLTSVMSNKEMMFTGYEFYVPCASILMWKGIYEKYRTRVENAIEQIISKVHSKNEEMFVYTFQSETLVFDKSELKFNLDIDERSRIEFNVPRYIISVVITKDKQIAFLTINDVFLLRKDGLNPFRKTNTFDEHCNEEQCIAYGYDRLIDDNRINFCCRLTVKFVETFMKIPKENSRELKFLRDFMSKKYKVLTNPK